jgi:hypothetical protein
LTRRASKSVALVLFALVSMPAFGLEVIRDQAAEHAGRYVVSIEVLLDAPREQVERVLTDYDRLHELHDSFISSEDLGEPEPGVTEVFTQVKGCVILFCKTLNRVERIRETDVGLVAEDVPGRGEFVSGRTVWTLTREGLRTRLVFVSSLKPDFWVPPLIGPGLLGTVTRRTTIEMLEAVEKRARRVR